MGGSPSTPIHFTPDYSHATFTGEELERQIALREQQATEALAAATGSTWRTAKYIIWTLVVLLILGAVAGITYYLWPKPSSIKLKINSAVFGNTDVTSQLQSAVRGDVLFLTKGVGDAPGVPPGLTGAGSISYQFSDEFGPTVATIKTPFESIDITQANRIVFPERFTNKGKTGYSGPSIWSRLTSMFSTGSGDQLPYSKDASAEHIIPATSSPSEGGAYGIQFWMYIKDWNYNFGKEKHVISRSDPSNTNIMNPNVTLHPTDNTLRVSVSVFPDNQNGSKAEPAPAGHSGSMDDVYLCEVPNIPLQSWVAVSITVFDRNLDVYLNGKLVKSCVLSGVPKPAVGDIAINKNGGFSGYVCGMNNYSKMLVPSDAAAFYGAGTSCSTTTGESSVVSKATGYSFSFGVYDASGKKVRDYVF